MRVVLGYPVLSRVLTLSLSEFCSSSRVGARGEHRGTPRCGAASGADGVTETPRVVSAGWQEPGAN